jgi:hypothetical protein
LTKEDIRFHIGQVDRDIGPKYVCQDTCNRYAANERSIVNSTQCGSSEEHAKSFTGKGQLISSLQIARRIFRAETGILLCYETMPLARIEL